MGVVFVDTGEWKNADCGRERASLSFNDYIERTQGIGEAVWYQHDVAAGDASHESLKRTSKVIRYKLPLALASVSHGNLNLS